MPRTQCRSATPDESSLACEGGGCRSLACEVPEGSEGGVKSGIEYRIFAQHFANNPASGRVMQKAGMHYEGMLRHCVQKEGDYHDTAIYAILKEDPRAPD